MRPLAFGLLIIGGAIAWAIKAAGQDIATLLPDGLPGFPTALRPAKTPDPEFQQLGIRSGDLLILPRLTEALGYDSNVLGGPNAQGSVALGTNASVQAKVDRQNETVGSFVSIDNLQTPELPGQARTDATASLGGAFHFGQNTLTLGSAYFFAHEDRTALDALPSDAPIPYQLADLRADYAVKLNRVTLTPNIELQLYRFGNASIFGSTVSQSYQNRNVIQYGLTGTYETAPDRNFVVVARGLSSLYTDQPTGQPTHDSLGWELLGGVDDRLDGVWRVRLLGGWQQRDFSNSAFSSHGALAAEADVVWSPTSLIDVTGSLARSIEDAAQESASGYIATAARLSMDYQWRRNVWLDGSVSLQHAAYLNFNGAQTGAAFEVGATWWINRRMTLNATETVSTVRGEAPPPSLGNTTRSISLISIGFGL